jgi:hypothetical protein
MEKIDVIVWQRDGVTQEEHAAQLVEESAPAILTAGAAELTVHTADTDVDVPSPTLLMGRGGDIAGVVSIWLDSIDDRAPMLAALEAVGASVDAYLVTESVPQRRGDRTWPDGERSPGITHFTCFPKPTRLTDEDFYRGWHEVHTPVSFRLHPRRWEYVRDAVVRPLTTGSRPLGAVVLERFRTVENYADPEQLYGGPETLEETMRDLPLYADVEDIDSRPLHETILRSR